MKREKPLAVAVLLGVAAAWTWFVTHPGGDPLPPGSTQLASVANWKEPSDPQRSGPAPKTYFWTTNGDLLHLEQDLNGATTVVRDHLAPFVSLQPDPAPPTPLPSGALFLCPTPDGSGLLYGITRASSHPTYELHLLDATGKNDRPLKALGAANMVWMPDGKHAITSRMEGDYLNSIDGTPPRLLDTKSFSAWTPYVLGVTPQSHAISTTGSDQFEPPAPFQRGNSLRYPTAVFTEFDPAAPTNTSKTWKVTMPPDSVRGQLILSPQTDRILWIVEKQPSGFDSWISRLQFSYNRPYSGDQALYVSQVNGANMKELFSAPTQRRRRGMNTTILRPLSDIRWLPDGKHISFIHQDSLYIAPVD